MAFYIQSVHSGLYLSADGDDGGKVIVHNFHGKKKPTVEVQQSRALDAGNSDDIIVLSDPNESAKQKWQFEDDFTIKNETGMVLDVQGGSKDAGAGIIAFKKHGGSNQKFRIILLKRKLDLFNDIMPNSGLSDALEKGYED